MRCGSFKLKRNFVIYVLSMHSRSSAGKGSRPAVVKSFKKQSESGRMYTLSIMNRNRCGLLARAFFSLHLTAKQMLQE